MSKRLLFVAAGIISTFSLLVIACAHSMSEQSFVEKASVANQFEIDSSKLTLRKSNNKDIKAFAQRMVSEHSQTGKEMKKAIQASDSRATPPAAGLDEKHQNLMKKLTSLSDRDFDKHYISMQIEAHKEAISLFTDYSKYGVNSTLRKFAADTLPHLKDHLKHIQLVKANY